MLSEFKNKIRSFLTGDKTRDGAQSRKRQLGSTFEDDTIATPPAKKAKGANGHSSLGTSFSKLTDWVRRYSTSVTENYYLRQLKQSPQKLVGKISTLSGAGSLSTTEANVTMRGHYQSVHTQSLSATSNAGHEVQAKTTGFSPMDDGKSRMVQMRETPIRPPQTVPMQVQQSPRSSYSQGYNFSDMRMNVSQAHNFNFAGGPRPGMMGPYPFGTAGPVPTFQGVNPRLQRPNGQQRNPNRHGYFQPKQSRNVFRSARNRNTMAVKESIRLDEKCQYATLLKQYKDASASRNTFFTLHNSERQTAVFFSDSMLGRPTEVQRTQERLPLAESTIINVDSVPENKPEQAGISERSFLDIRSRRLSREGRGQEQQSSYHSTFQQSDVLTRDYQRLSVKPGLAQTLFPQISQGTRETSQSASQSDGSSSPEIIEITPPSLPRSPFIDGFEKVLKEKKYISDEWFEEMKDKFSPEVRKRERQIKEEEVKVQVYKEKRENLDEQLERTIRKRLTLAEREPPVIEDEYIEDKEEEEEEGADEFPELSDEQEAIVENAFRPRPGEEILVEGYKLQIMRKDIATLAGLNWLNDEVINFYMNMLMDRGNEEGSSKVHAFNTFFYPKIMGSGYAGVRRWTRRADIFAVDYVLVPVHLGMHWCLAVIDFKRKEIRYYDSMGGRNLACLNILKQYLNEESMDKKKQPYDTSDWKLLTMTDIPQQMNGSDCGMFTCKFAEYITRDAPVTFSQEHMPYFRRRMVLEIVSKQLL